MARQVRNRKVDSRTARLTLKARREPYWTRLERGLALGYRRTATATGTWVARRYNPQATPRLTYEALGTADDTADNIGLSYDAAQKAAREWFEGASGSVGAERSQLTVKAAFIQYVAYLRRHKSPSAVYNAEGALLGNADKRGKPRKCTLAPFHDVLLIDLTKKQLEGWQDARITAEGEAGRRQKDTTNRILNAVKAALTRAADDKDNGYPATAPRQWERVKSFEKVARPRTLFLSRDQTRRLLNAVGRGALHDLTYAAFLIGIRPGLEMKALKVGDFDAGSSTLTLDAGKTGGRTIWINPEAVALFERLTAGRKADEPLFRKDDGTPWGDPNEWNRPLKKAAKRVGLPTGRDGVCLYTARHSHISSALVVKNRMPVQMLAENCGTSQKMIETNYGKFTNEDRRRFVDAGTVRLGIVEKSNVKRLGAKQ